jgi:CheY-like chemotaxis protein
MKKRLTIAKLEDDSDDRYLTKEMISDLGFDLEIDFFSKSNELFASLKERKPHLILIDDNSIPENGLEVLKKLKNGKDERAIPAVILSDSLDPKHRAKCYEAGANAFVLKPGSLHETKQKIKSFFSYWTEVAEPYVSPFVSSYNS